MLQEVRGSFRGKAVGYHGRSPYPTLTKFQAHRGLKAIPAGNFFQKIFQITIDIPASSRTLTIPQFPGSDLMNSQLFDEASKVISDPQVLINMVSKRVRQLSASSRPMVAVDPRMGLMDIALAEIAQGKLVFTPAVLTIPLSEE